MTAREVAAIFQEIGVLLELKGENPFKSRAYTAAARTLESLDRDLGELVAEGGLGKLPGIGAALEEKIAILVRTGRLPYYEELRASVPPGLLDLLRVPGLGPRRARALNEALGIDSLEGLARACREGKVACLSGFGERTQQSILEGIDRLGRHAGLSLFPAALQVARTLCERLEETRGVKTVEVAGSLRRFKEVVKDIDLVAASERPAEVIRAFTAFPEVERVSAGGDTRASVLTRAGMAADLRVVRPAELPFALCYFTGSAEHNTALRRRANQRGLKLNEYGLFRGDTRLRCAGEAAMYRALGLAFIPPELRENLGEVEAAAAGPLPRLVTEKDIRGLLHVHTRWSDGEDTLEGMARAGAALGVRYLGIADHSQAARYAGGLGASELARQATELAAVNRKKLACRLLHGSEADILPDGRVDVPEASRLDFVVASVHSGFKMRGEEMTRRVLRALADPRVSVLGHPTGRLLLKREAYSIDLEPVFREAARRGVAIEINAHPERLDLDWRHLRRARELGVRFVIGPDSHRAQDLTDFRYGVAVARKGWLGPADLLNTLSTRDLAARLRRAG